MTDKNVSTSAPAVSVAPIPAAAPAPVAQSPSTPAPTPSPEAVQVAEQAPAPQTSPEASPTKEAIVDKKPTTLLGSEPIVESEVKVDAPKAEEVKKDAPVEAEKAPEPKKEEVKQSDEPAPLPTYEAFKLPEGFSADDTKLSAFTGILAEIELAKGDHTKLQEAGQKLVDRHIAELQSAIQKQNDFYLDAFEKQKDSWKEAFEKDPDIGGNRQETTVSAAKEFIRTHGGTDDQQKEFRELLNTTGLGNHPAMIRLLANANSFMREGKPLPAGKPEAQQAKSKVEKRYGRT